MKWLGLITRRLLKRSTKATAPPVEPPLDAELSPDEAQETEQTEGAIRQYAQALVSENVTLVFDVRWAPVTSETRMSSLLEGARQEGFVYYVTNSYQETVGLAGRLPDGLKKPHSAALILSQQFAQGGTELFIFQKGAQFGLVGLVDYSPIPGFDAIGTQDEIQLLAQEFTALNSSQLMRYYGNVDWYPEVESIDLAKLAHKAAVSSSGLKPLPNLKLRAALVVAAIAVLGIIYAGYDYYQELLAEQSAAEQAVLQDPNRLYEQSIEIALKTTGAPGVARLEQWREFFSKMPLTVSGWSAKTVTCIPTRCDVAWTRTSGNFKDFDLALPEDTYGLKNFKLDKGLVSTEISTSHELSKFPKPEGMDQSIERSLLSIEDEAKKLWGSQLQDISLLAGTTVTMDAMTLFGTSTASADTLNKPIMKGAWSIDHDMWSFTDLNIPNFVVPEMLTIKVDLKNGLRYKLEGSYYAKGK
jgi:hypothetical protein